MPRTIGVPTGPKPPVWLARISRIERVALWEGLGTARAAVTIGMACP
jgi:hypothetical protein